MKKGLLALLFILMLPVVANGQSVSKSRLLEIERQAKQKNLEQKKLDKQVSEVGNDLKVVSSEMIKTAREIQKSEKKLSEMEDELKNLEENLKIAEAKFMEDDENLIKTLAALENLALKPTEALFVQPLNPVDIIRSAILLRETVPHLEERAIRIKQELKNIEAKKRNIEKQIKRISIRKNRMQQEHSTMKALSVKKKSLQKNLTARSKKTAVEAKKLASRANDIKSLLANIEKEKRLKAQKQEQERQRLLALEKKKNLGATSSEELISSKSDNIISNKAFELAKGTMSLPAIGKIVTTFGELISKGMHSKGVTIKTRGMAQITNPFDGNVMFVGPFRGYKNLIIIDHGGGYMSLISGMEDIDCELGQTLLAGEPIGQMPRGSNTELYVELRKDNNPINPLRWMKKG